MVTKFEIDNIQCLCCTCPGSHRMAYIIYPMDILSGWIEQAAEKYGTNIAVITGMEWQDAMSPWTAACVPRGCPDFKGEAPAFLTLLQQKIIPAVEAKSVPGGEVRRSLVGVSMSGLFALWQWMLCDTFTDIVSLSGSFWYEGFLDWMKSRQIPHKTGLAFFLLGDREAASRVKAFAPVAENTREIIAMLGGSGVRTQFLSVPGNHYSDPIPRLEKAFEALFSDR